MHSTAPVDTAHGVGVSMTVLVSLVTTGLVTRNRCHVSLSNLQLLLGCVSISDVLLPDSVVFLHIMCLMYCIDTTKRRTFHAAISIM